MQPGPHSSCDESATQNGAAGGDTCDARLGKILDDYLRARACGEGISEAELLAQHPELADELRQMLTVVGDLRPDSDQIETLIAQRILDRSADGRYLAELGPYAITGYIGRGGMGIVLKAYEARLNRTVALKILRPEVADDRAVLARFEREAKAAAGLRHPNIVTVHAVGEEHDRPYIAMEYVDGASLADVVRGRAALGHEQPGVRWPLDAMTVQRVFGQLLAGLMAAHEAGLIHRDIKSSNILVEEWSPGASDERSEAERTEQNPPEAPARVGVKIVDFGLARMRGSQTQLTLADSVLGTPEYMSPEQARGDEDIDHRTDLYSAGVVLYELLTGHTPFKADTPTATIRRILDEAPAPPRSLSGDVDPHLASLALWLMAKRPEDRPNSARVAAEALVGRRV